MQKTALSASMTLSFVFGMVFILAILALIILHPNPTARQFEIFKIVVALAAGGVAAAIPGVIDMQMRTGPKFALRAGGALGVFAIVFFYSPAKWEGYQAEDSSKNTTLEVNPGSDASFIGALDRSYKKADSPIYADISHQD